MKALLLALCLCGFLQPTLAGAKTVSCRDARGALYIADNLMSLPEECRQKGQTLSPENSGNVNFVPATPPSTTDNQAFERAVKEEDQARTDRNNKAAGMLSRAKKLVETYESALDERKSAIRNKTYGSRKNIIKAEQDMQQARRGKEDLLSSLARAYIPTSQKQQIRKLLERIKN